jgi:hypothetical protein
MLTEEQIKRSRENHAKVNAYICKRFNLKGIDPLSYQLTIRISENIKLTIQAGTPYNGDVAYVCYDIWYRFKNKKNFRKIGLGERHHILLDVNDFEKQFEEKVVSVIQNAFDTMCIDFAVRI